MKCVLAFVFGLLALCLPGAAYAQGRTPVVVSGHAAGAIPSLEANGVAYVDVQAAARKFGAGVELFAQSKQAKLRPRVFTRFLPFRCLK